MYAEVLIQYGVKILDYDFIEEPKEELVRGTPIIMPCDYKEPTLVRPYEITCDKHDLDKHIPTLI